MRAVFFALAILAGSLGITASPAQAERSTIFKDPTGVAIEGYDVVAYGKEKKAVEGSQKIRQDWNSASWYFSSKENRDLFQADPKSFAPQYGGYCAYALAGTNQLVPADPKMWKIIDGKLYLFASFEAQQIFTKRAKKLVQTADKNWKGQFTTPK